MIFSKNLFRRPTPARLTRIEKSLLQAYFHSVNYCQYNIVNYRTFISVSGSLSLVIANMYLERRIHAWNSCIKNINI